MVTAVILVALGLLVPAVGVAATPAARRRAVTRGYVVAGLLVVAAGAVFALVADGATLLAVDTPVLAWMVAHRGAGLTALAEGLALFGGTTFTGGLAVVTAVILAVRGLRVWAVCWVVAVAAGASAIRLLKLGVERPRPPVDTRLAVETTTSLPSGHALMAALGLGLTAAAIVLVTRPGRRLLHTVAVGLAVVLAVAIGVSRAYLGVHWTTDVVAGWLIGTAIVTLTAAVARDRQPVGTRRPVDDRPGTSADPGRDTDAPDRTPSAGPVDPARTTGRPADPGPTPPAVPGPGAGPADA